MDIRKIGKLGRTRFLAVTTLGLAVVSGGAGAFSLALFTDTAQVTGNSFTTSTIDINASPASAAVSLSNMMPGDTTNGTITVSNGASSGGAQLRYAMTSTSTNDDSKNLRDQLNVVVKTRDVAADACTDFTGTELYNGSLGSAGFGSTAQGSQTGDRTLNAAASEKLCFRVSLPLATGNSFQGAATTAQFTFTAEQTANN